MKPGMSDPAACTENISLYVMLHKLGMFGYL